MAKKKKKVKKSVWLILMIMIVVTITITFFINHNNTLKKNKEAFLGSNVPKLSLYNENKESVIEVTRGLKVKVYINQVLEDGYIKIKYDNKEYYAKQENIVYDKKDIVKETEVYVRTSYNLYESSDGIKLLDLCNKGDKLTIIGYDKLNEDGTVNMYQVKTSDDVEGYFYKKYVVDTEDDLEIHGDAIYEIHSGKKDTLGGGDGASLDYYPVEKPVFEDNKMPDNVYSLYL